MNPPDEWVAVLLGYWRARGLCGEHARECLGEAFLRYRRKPALPAWGEGKPPPALWRLARDLLYEHWRCRSREQKRVEQLHTHCECRYERSYDDALEAQTFQLSLSPRLNEVLTLRLEGYTCQQIAQQLGLSVGTVKSYLAELRQKFTDFYGYDPTKRPSVGGYIYGSIRGDMACAQNEKEGSSDASAHSSGRRGGGSSGGKRVRPAAHPRRARRRAGGSGSRESDAG